MKILLLFFSMIFMTSCIKEVIDLFPQQADTNIQQVVTLSGRIKWEHDPTKGVGNVTVRLRGTALQTVVTDSSGYYSFTVNVGDSCVILPSKQINTTNGLSALDVSLIQNHLTGQPKLPTFYKTVAADANKSYTISTLDASVIQQAILGNPVALGILNTTKSWRFIPSDFVVPNPLPVYNLPSFPETKTVPDIQSNTTVDFVGLKVGDVNGSANKDQ